MIPFADIEPEVTLTSMRLKVALESKQSAVPCLPVHSLLPEADNLNDEADEGANPHEHQPDKKELSKP